MKYVFIDEGSPGDESVAVGPFDSEQEARDNADSRTVMALWSLGDFLASPQAQGR